MDKRKVKQFLDEYTRAHPLSKEELFLLPTLIAKKAIIDFWFNYKILRNEPGRAIRTKDFTNAVARMDYYLKNREVLETWFLRWS